MRVSLINFGGSEWEHLGIVGVFGLFLAILLIYGSSQELDVVSKPNLHNKNDVDGLKANYWACKVCWALNEYFGRVSQISRFFFYYCEIYVNGTYEM